MTLIVACGIWAYLSGGYAIALFLSEATAPKTSRTFKILTTMFWPLALPLLGFSISVASVVTTWKKVWKSSDDS